MATQRDIEHHYDESPALFRAFLGPSMIYSCANWEGAATLDEAQEAKVRKLLAFAEIGQGTRSVLDIGCGWGGFLRSARRALGRGPELVGVTISPAQAHYARTFLADDAPVAIHHADFFAPDALTDGAFDAAVSVGAFEHFASARHRLAGTHVARYREFFALARRRVRGPLALQTIVSLRDIARVDAEERRRVLRYLMFVTKAIFPNSLVPQLEDVHAAVEGFYRVDRADVVSANYARTLRAWRENLAGAAGVPPEARARFERFFDLGAEQFDTQYLGLAQLRLVPV